MFTSSFIQYWAHFNISPSFPGLVKRKADFHLEEGGKTMPAWICILKV